ncbi:MAG: diacylglycerol kinase family protein [Ferruginibacter sp.]
MKVFRSFYYAWSGIRYCFTTQLNFRIHLLIMLLVIIAGFLFNISATEWLFIVLCCMLVLMLEMINTALEYLCDVITTEFNPVIKVVKDVTAGAVLVSAVGSIVTGTVIFLPKIISFLK